MERLIYNADTKEIVAIIKDCEGTSTGTPFEMFEGSADEVEQKITELGLMENESAFRAAALLPAEVQQQLRDLIASASASS